MNIKKSKKKLSIAFVNPVFIPEYYEGSGKSTLRLISNLKIDNINAFVLAPRLKKETSSESLIENILVKRFKVNNHPNLGGSNIFSFIVWSIKLTYWLLKNSSKFDLIHIIHGRLHSVPAIFADGSLLFTNIRFSFIYCFNGSSSKSNIKMDKKI